MEKDNVVKPKKTINYDGIVKQIINNMQSDKIIQFLGNLFEKNYTSESTLIKLNSETQNIDNQRRISDLYLKVDNDFFNIEIQSTDDRTMAMRIFEYGVRGAIAHGRTYSDDFSKLTLDVPEPVVIYLRKTGNTPDKFTIELNLPGDDNTASYDAKVKFIQDYSIEDMIKNQMYPMIPFYPMRYEAAVNKTHDPATEDLINSDMMKAITQLKLMIQEQLIQPGDLCYIVEAMSVVYEKVMLKGQNVNTEKVGAMMEMIQQETVTFFDVYDAMANSKTEGFIEGKMEGKIEGKIEGEIEGIIKMAMKLMEIGIPMDAIQKSSGLNDDGMAKLIEQYKMSHESHELNDDTVEFEGISR